MYNVVLRSVKSNYLSILYQDNFHTKLLFETFTPGQLSAGDIYYFRIIHKQQDIVYDPPCPPAPLRQSHSATCATLRSAAIRTFTLTRGGQPGGEFSLPLSAGTLRSRGGRINVRIQLPIYGEKGEDLSTICMSSKHTGHFLLKLR